MRWSPWDMLRRLGNSAICMVGLVAGLAFFAAGAAPAYGAGTGYGPTPPPTPAPPSSICSSGSVITSSTLSPSGGTVTGNVNGSTVTVTVPAGAFPAGVQAAIVAITASAPTGDTIVLDFGVNFCVNGAKVTGTFPTPVTVTVTNPNIKPGQTLYIVTPGGLVPVAGASIGTGTFTLTIASDPDFVLVTAASEVTSVIPGATNVVTGKPFLLEAIVGGGLVCFGALLLLRLRFRHQ